MNSPIPLCERVFFKPVSHCTSLQIELFLFPDCREKMATCFPPTWSPCVSLRNIYFRCAYRQPLTHSDSLGWMSFSWCWIFFFFFLREAFKSDSRCGVACPLDVADDTAISQRQDSHSLSFAVSPYMPSVDIAVLLQRRMSRRFLSVGCCRLC